jgi:hypothetical protein
VHDQASAGTRGVDRIGQAAEVDSSCAEFGDQRNEVREGSPKPIQFPDNEGVARAEGSKGSIETAARGNAAAHALVRENTLASCSRERIALQSEVLVSRRDTGVAASPSCMSRAAASPRAIARNHASWKVDAVSCAEGHERLRHSLVARIGRDIATYLVLTDVSRHI